MPVITTSATVSGVTTTTYQIDVDVSRLKTAPKIRAQRVGTGGSFAYSALTKNSKARIRFYKDVSTPNTAPGTINAGIFPCGADYWLLPFSIPKVLFNVATSGNQVGNTTICTHYENPIVVSGNTISQNVYVVKIAQIFPDDTCIEADLGYPFGTVHILFGNAAAGGQITSATPPAGWVRNREKRNWSGYIKNRDSYQVNALGSQIFYQGNSVSFGMNDYFTGFTPGTLPAFTFARDQPMGSGNLYGWNYQTNTVMRSNVTVKGRWRGMDYKNTHGGGGTFYLGAYIGSSFAMAFTDTSPTTAIVALNVTFAQSLPVPAIPAGQYSALLLEITATSDSVTVGGTTFTTTDIATFRCGNYGNSSTGSILNFTMGPPPYYPWDVKLRSYGTDDATVRYARHAGYIPLTSAIPASIADTVVAPILSRSGKLIILQGGFPRGPFATTQYPTAATATITGIAFSTVPALTSTSGGSIRIRIVSLQYGAEWSTIAGLGEAQEYTTTAGPTATGIWRQVISRYYDATNYYEGPAVYLSDICFLQNNANGLAGNIAIVAASSLTNADSTTGYSGFAGARVRGMAGGDVAIKAQGNIQLVAVPLFGDTLTIGDGIIKKVFEFGRSFVGSTMVAIGADIDTCNASLIAAINASGLAITASVPTPTDWQAEVTLLHTRDQAGGPRTTGNQWVAAVP